MCLLMPWSASSLRTDAFTDVREFLGQQKRWLRFPYSYQGFAKAAKKRFRALADVVWKRFQAHGQQLAGDEFRWRGWVPMAIDGSRLECPRSVANEAILGCAGRKKTSPQVQLTSLLHLNTALPWTVRCGPGTVSEKVHCRELLDDLPPRTLLVGDTGFFDYETADQLIHRGHAFVLRVGGNKTLLKDLMDDPDFEFGEGQQIYVWPERWRRLGARPLSLRLIELKTDDPKQPNVFLLTNLNEEQLSDTEVADWYARRWDIELSFRAIKQTLEQTKLRSRTPELALIEAESLAQSLFLLGSIVIPARRAGDPPATWSPANVLRTVRRRIKHATKRGAQWSKRLAKDLRECGLDNYTRKGPKSTRRHPQKKKDKPPKPPIIRPATLEEIKEAQLLMIE